MKSESLAPSSLLRRHVARLARLAPVALLLGSLASAAQAAVPAGWVGTTATAHAVGSAKRIGALAGDEPVHVVVSLKPRNKDQLDVLTTRLMTGQSGAQSLSPAQFLTLHAPTTAQVETVTTYLKQQGFTKIEVAGNRLLISATGPARAAEAAFQTRIERFDVAGRSAFANVTDALVPQRLSGTVLGIVGLQTVHTAKVHARRLAASQSAQGSVSGVSIPQFASIYGAAGMPAASNATIGIITQGDLTQTLADLNAFAASAGYPAPSVKPVVIGTPSSDTSGTDEWNMDTQSSLGAAGGVIKSMLLYNVNSLSDADLTEAYNRAVVDNQAKVINVSLGGCELDESAVEGTQDLIFQTAVAQGQTFSVSSGDSGAYECGPLGGKAQSYPAVSPYVMAIGGTSLSTDGGSTWAGETVWSCAGPVLCQQLVGGGAGGGSSLTEAAPAWQTSAGVLGASRMRGVPDVSFDASPDSGALVLVSGSWVQIGGTSLAAPLFTGFYSRVQSVHGNKLPFPAGLLYQGAAGHANWFHDVTLGNQGYGAASGWDYASGFGSLQIGNFSASF